MQWSHFCTTSDCIIARLHHTPGKYFWPSNRGWASRIIQPNSTLKEMRSELPHTDEVQKGKSDKNLTMYPYHYQKTGMHIEVVGIWNKLHSRPQQHVVGNWPTLSHMQPYLLAQKKREKDTKEERPHLACTGSFTQEECFLLPSGLLVAEICTFSLLLLEPFPKSHHLRKDNNSILDSH